MSQAEHTTLATPAFSRLVRLAREVTDRQAQLVRMLAAVQRGEVPASGLVPLAEGIAHRGSQQLSYVFLVAGDQEQQAVTAAPPQPEETSWLPLQEQAEPLWDLEHMELAVAPWAAPTAATSTQPIRELVLAALDFLGVPASARTVSDIARPLFGRELDSRQFASLRRNEAAAYKRNPLARPAWITTAITCDGLHPLPRVLTSSAWAPEQRLIGSRTERVNHLRTLLTLLEARTRHDNPVTHGALDQLIRRFAQTVPGALPQRPRVPRKPQEAAGWEGILWPASTESVPPRPSHASTTPITPPAATTPWPPAQYDADGTAPLVTGYSTGALSHEDLAHIGAVAVRELDAIVEVDARQRAEAAERFRQLPPEQQVWGVDPLAPAPHLTLQREATVGADVSGRGTPGHEHRSQRTRGAHARRAERPSPAAPSEASYDTPGAAGDDPGTGTGELEEIP